MHAKEHTAEAHHANGKVEEAIRRGKREAHDAASDVRDAVDAVKDDLQEVARRAGKSARRMADDAEHEMEDFGKDIKDKVRDNPLMSLAAAAGLGIVFGLLYRR